jgi:phosphonate transport system substrate-binding protein
VWRKDIDGEMKVKLRNFFAGYGKGANGAEEQKRLLGIQEWVGFKESSNAQLLPIRQIELFQQKTKLEADSSLPAAEKRAKIEEIDHRLADLGRQLAAAAKK